LQEDFSFRNFNVTIDCFYSWPIGTVVDSMPGNPDIRATRNGAQQHMGKSRDVIRLKVPLPVGDLDCHLIHSSFSPTQVHIRNGISIGSAIFAGLMVITDQQTTLLRV